MNAQFFPLAIFVVMLSLGMSLQVEDFRRAAKLRRPLAAALGCQLVLLPVIGLAFAQGFALSPALAVGLMLTLACPGGALANIFSHLANGDVALNLTLTAINAALAVAALPVILFIAMHYFMGGGEMIPLQFSKLSQVVAFILVPTSIGMLLRHVWPVAADRLTFPCKILMAILVVGVITQAIITGWDTLTENFWSVGPAVVSINLVSLTVGYVVPRFMRLGGAQALAISLEIGLHNAALAMSIALSPQLLNSAEMAVPAALYGISAIVVASAFIAIVKRVDPEPARSGLPQPQG